MERNRRTDAEINEELRKKPILPPEGMKFPPTGEYFMPNLLLKGNYFVYLRNICKKVKRSLPVLSAFRMNKINDNTYWSWIAKYRKEKEKYEDTEFTTPLIMFFDAIYEAEANSEDALVDVLVTSAVDDGNTDSAKYLLDKRHKWKEVKGIEVDTDEDKSLEISITPMQDNFKEDNEEE